MDIEKPGALCVDGDWLYTHFHVAILPECAALAFAWLKSIHVNPQRAHMPQPFSGPGFSVAVEYRSEMTPAQLPQRIHLLGRLAPTDEVFVFDRLHGGIVPKKSRLSTVSWRKK